MKRYKLRKKVKGALKGIGEEDVDGVVSATEMTGLVAPMPESNEQKDNYNSIIHFTQDR